MGIGVFLAVLCSACGIIGGSSLAEPVVISGPGNQVVQKTRLEKMQERLDSISLSAQKNSDGIYHVFTISWPSLVDVLESNDKLSLERIAPDQTKEYAIFTNAVVNYKDQGVPAVLNQTYTYRLKVKLTSGEEMFSKTAVSGTVSVDPPPVIPTKPLPPKPVMQGNQTSMLQLYLNGFKVLWIDDSDNETKFEIEKCVEELVTTEYQDGSQSTNVECVATGNTIVVNTAADPSFIGQREYFDSDVGNSSFNDQPWAGFTSAGYCYSIRAVNAVGASNWIGTECRRFE